MKKFYFLFFSLFLFIGATNAQEQDAERKQRIAEYKAKRTAYLTERINLNHEQSGRFWTLYEEYQDKRMLLLRTFRKEMREFKKIDSPIDKEYKKIVDSDLEVKSKEVELMQEYYSRFRKILTSEQTYKLMQAEEDFAKDYLNRRADNRKE